MTTSLTLATQRPFGTLTCDFYKNDSGEFYMTRDQIGQALEYPAGAKAIAQIHSRNTDRLNPMSGVLKMKTPGGEQDTFVYNLRGVMEICRFSRQPKADKFMDFVWDVMDALMQGETVLTPVQQQQAASSSVTPPSYLSARESSAIKATADKSY